MKTENKMTMELTQQEVALIERRRNKNIKIQEVIDNKIKQSPTLNQFLKMAGIKTEDLEKKFSREIFVILSKDNTLGEAYNTYPRTEKNSAEKTIIVYSVQIKKFAKQKLIGACDIKISVIDGRVVDIDAPFVINHEWWSFNMERFLPDIKNNLIIKIKLYNYNIITRMEESVEATKRRYEAEAQYLREIKANLGKEYETLKTEFAPTATK